MGEKLNSVKKLMMAPDGSYRCSGVAPRLGHFEKLPISQAAVALGRVDFRPRALEISLIGH
jgi:hypothetical protein